MAVSSNTTNLSRRAALTGAMAALSTVPAIAATVPDDDRQEWLALYRAFCEAESHVCPAINARYEAEAVAKLEYPKRPRAGRKAWEAQCAEIARRYDLPALKAAEEAAWAATRAAEAAIVDKPANGITGIAVKLALWVRLDGEPPDVNETVEDATEHLIAIAAWRDAVRLAGLPAGLGSRAI